MSTLSAKKKVIPKQLTRKVISRKDREFFASLIKEKLHEFNGSVEHLLNAIKENGHDNCIQGNVFEHGSEEQTKVTNALLCERDKKTVIGMIKALERIENGTYGVCPHCVIENHKKLNFKEVTITQKISTIKKNPNNYIEFERLKAYPAAKNCIRHTKK